MLSSNSRHWKTLLLPPYNHEIAIETLGNKVAVKKISKLSTKGQIITRNYKTLTRFLKLDLLKA